MDNNWQEYLSSEAIENILRVSETMSRSIEVAKPTIDRVNKLYRSLDPLFETINKEYKVDKNEYDKAIDTLLGEGYFLPFSATPRQYIDLYNQFKKGNIENVYIAFFKETGDSVFSASELIELLSEYTLKGWEEPLKVAKDLSLNTGIENSYKLVLPFYFSYMESFLRFNHEDRGKSFRTSGLFESARSTIISSDNKSKDTKDFYCKILDSTKNYFYERFDKSDNVTRNSVLHGFLYPDEWKLIDFYKTIALLSFFVYLYAE